MKKRIGVLCAVIFLAYKATLLAQPILADPNDPIYADIDAWATKGLLKNLPRLRPYTFTMAQGLLKEVRSSGGHSDVESASRYLEALEDKAFHFMTDARAVSMIVGGGLNYALLAAPGLKFNMLLGQSLGLSARIEGWPAYGDAVNDLMPYGTRYDRDLLYGSGSKLDDHFEIVQDLISDMSYGSESIGIQAGYMRGSWGPVYDDGIVLGPQAPESGQLTFSWRSRAVTADIGFLMLQQGWSDQSGIKDSKGKSVGFNSQKYLMVHGVTWAPKGWLELGFFESMVWVDRFEPLYFIPLSELFLSQSVASYGDNESLGISATAYLPQSSKLDMVAYVDDIDFAGLVKGNLDTKIKVAGQACLSWAPESPVVHRVSLDYTAVLPYTYTHWVVGGTDSVGNPYYGALAYTNAGQNLGPALDPNSDRVTLQAKSKELSGARIGAFARLIRHGNASAVNGYSAATSGNNDASGDIGDSGMINVGDGFFAFLFQADRGYETGTWPKYLRFLTQRVLQVSAQAGFTVDYRKPLEDVGAFKASLGYTFEYIANDGCVEGATSVKNYMTLAFGIDF